MQILIWRILWFTTWGITTWQLLEEGRMNFLNTTLANYWSGSNREDPMLFISNRYSSGESSEEAVNLDLRFGNTIIYGSKEEELELDSSTAADYNVFI